jgi:hypothetical protein
MTGLPVLPNQTRPVDFSEPNDVKDGSPSAVRSLVTVFDLLDLAKRLESWATNFVAANLDWDAGREDPVIPDKLWRELLDLLTDSRVVINSTQLPR